MKRFLEIFHILEMFAFQKKIFKSISEVNSETLYFQELQVIWMTCSSKPGKSVLFQEDFFFYRLDVTKLWKLSLKTFFIKLLSFCCLPFQIRPYSKNGIFLCKFSNLISRQIWRAKSKIKFWGRRAKGTCPWHYLKSESNKYFLRLPP